MACSRPWARTRAHGDIRHSALAVDPADGWLRGLAEEAFALARECPSEDMRIVQEGFDKEDLLAV